MGLTDEEVERIIKDRQRALESFLSHADWAPLEYDDDAEEYEEIGNTQITEWLIIGRHHDFDRSRDFYSVMRSPGQAPHSTLGLLYTAIDFFA